MVTLYDHSAKAFPVMEHLKLFVARINIPKVGTLTHSELESFQANTLKGYKSYGKSASVARACLPLHEI
jgi:hypothetical protein